MIHWYNLAYVSPGVLNENPPCPLTLSAFPAALPHGRRCLLRIICMPLGWMDWIWAGRSERWRLCSLLSSDCERSCSADLLREQHQQKPPADAWTGCGGSVSWDFNNKSERRELWALNWQGETLLTFSLLLFLRVFFLSRRTIRIIANKFFHSTTQRVTRMERHGIHTRRLFILAPPVR